VVWLDVLDLPLVYYMEASYHIEGQRQAVKPGRGDQAYAAAAASCPPPVFTRSNKAYPMLRYPWAKPARRWVAGRRPARSGAVQVTYVNPETGGDVQNILGFYALMLRPGQTLKLPARSPARSST
jgi:gentisate 1,2-dioxygenase